MIGNSTRYFSSKNNFSNAIVCILLLFMVMAVLQQANPLNTNLQRDSGAFIYVASSFFKGGMPYLTAWENKPPGVFFVNALGLLLGKGTRWGIWGVEFIFLYMASWVAYKFLSRYFDIIIAVAGSAIWLFGLNLILEGGNFTEEYSLLFSFTALLCWTLSLQREHSPIFYDAVVGLCTGIGIIFRPNNIGVQVSIILCILLFSLREKDFLSLRKRLLIIGLTAVIPILASALFFYFNGAFKEFLDASLLYNLSYTGRNSDFLNSIIVGVNSLGLTAGVGALGYIAVLVHFKHQYIQGNISPIILWAVIDGVLEALLSGLSGRSYQHYFICWLPFLAFCSAFLINIVLFDELKWLKRSTETTLVFATLACFIMIPGVISGYYDSFNQLLFHREKGVQKVDPVAAYIDASTQPGDFVLIWGFQAGLNYLSGRDSPTPYIMYPLFVPSELTEQFSREYYQSLQETPPILVVDASFYSPAEIIPLNEKSPISWSKEHSIYPNPYLTEVMAFIRKNYNLQDVIKGVSIYRYIDR
jgi:hypothetical protein